MGLLFKSGNAKAAREWLKNHYSAYPEGIDKLYSPWRSSTVLVKLEEPLDVELLSSIIDEHDLVAEVSQEPDGTNILNIYNVIEDQGQIITKSLRSVFRGGTEVEISENPISGQSPHPRLVFLTEYLNEKYS